MATTLKQPALDQEYLRINYHETGYSYLLPDSLALLNGQARIYQHALEVHHRRGDLASVAAEAHGLKGAAGSLGAAALSELADAIEQAAEARDTAQLLTLFEALPGCVQETVQAINQELVRLAEKDNAQLDQLF